MRLCINNDKTDIVKVVNVGVAAGSALRLQ